MPDSKPTLTITTNDIARIKDAAHYHFSKALPPGLDAKELQTLLICQGFIDFLGRQGIKLPVEIDYEWRKHVRSKKEL